MSWEICAVSAYSTSKMPQGTRRVITCVPEEICLAVAKVTGGDAVDDPRRMLIEVEPRNWYIMYHGIPRGVA